MRIRPFLPLLCLVLSATTSAQETSVGRLADPETWRIDGLTTFTADEVKRSLAFDFDALRASHPQAPIQDLPKVLQRRALEGFRHSGFPAADVNVTVNQATGSVAIVVQEGTRCWTRRIIVKGVDESLASTLRARLAGPQLDTRKATPHFDASGEVLEWIGPDGKEIEDRSSLWKKGRPAPFDGTTLRKIRDRVGKTIRDAGFIAPHFDCHLAAHETVADLIVEVSDLGTPSIVTDIEIRGNKRNSDTEIIRYLNISTGILFTGERRRQLLHELWESGRFAEHRVDAEWQDSGVKLKITVAEAPGVPTLSQPLSKEAAALLKCREWITVGPGNTRDLVIQGAGLRWELIFSNRGLLGTWRRQADPAALPDFALRVSADGIGFYDLANHCKLRIKCPAMKINVTATESVKAEGTKRPFHLTFGLGATKRDPNASEPPLELQNSAAPAYFAALASLDAKPSVWEGDLVSVPVRGGLFRVNARTGELAEYQMRRESGEVVVSVTSAVARFETRWRELSSVVACHENEYDSARPFSSIVSFISTGSHLDIIRDLYGNRFDTDTLAHLAILRSLSRLGFFRVIDELVIESSTDPKSNDGFNLPQNAPPNIGKVGVTARVSIGFADYLFPRDSWPWSVWREVGFTVGASGSIGPYTQRELRRLIESEECGPLGHWLLAELFSRLKQDQLATAIAARGISKLGQTDFHHDAETVLRKSMGFLVPVFRQLGDLSPEERALAADLLSVEAALFDRLMDSTRDLSAEQAPEALLQMLDQLWVNEWRSHVKARLQQIISKTRPSARMARR